MSTPPRTITVPQPLNRPKETKMSIDLKTHIEQSVRNAVTAAVHDVKAEELRLIGLGQKVAGPFERFGRAVRAGIAAFKAVMSAQS
jgi:hypothetical protein